MTSAGQAKFQWQGCMFSSQRPRRSRLAMMFSAQKLGEVMGGGDLSSNFCAELFPILGLFALTARSSRSLVS